MFPLLYLTLLILSVNLIQPTAEPTAEVSVLLPLVEAGNNGEPANRFPLKECEADCDSNEECSGDLICFQTSGTISVSVPGCIGEENNGNDYCVKPMPNLLNRIGNGGSGYRLCQGDCDRDSDCDVNLICFQRDGLESVPSCIGEGRSGTDYCILPTV